MVKQRSSVVSLGKVTLSFEPSASWAAAQRAGLTMTLYTGADGTAALWFSSGRRHNRYYDYSATFVRYLCFLAIGH